MYKFYEPHLHFRVLAWSIYLTSQRIQWESRRRIKRELEQETSHETRLNSISYCGPKSAWRHRLLHFVGPSDNPLSTSKEPDRVITASDRFSSNIQTQLQRDKGNSVTSGHRKRVVNFSPTAPVRHVMLVQCCYPPLDYPIFYEIWTKLQNVWM